MFPEQLVIKISVFLERIYHIRIQVNCQQTTWIIRAQRNLSTRIRGNCSVPQICIAVRHALPNNRVPEQDTRFSRFPCVINNLIPQLYRTNLFHVFRFVRIYRIFLNIITFFDNRIHELIINFHRNISSGYFPLGHFRINETFWIRVIDGNTQHQRPPTTILRHLPGRIRITLHERNNSSRSQSRVFHWRPFRTNMGQVMSYSTSSFHQLHLLLINLHYPAIGIRRTIMSYHETVRKGCNLIIVADSRHRPSLRNDIFEITQHLENLFFRHRVRVISLNPSNLWS